MTYKKLEKAYKKIRQITDFEPELAIVLGSGLGKLADQVQVIKEISYSDIDDFPVSTAPGHKGRFIFTEIHGVKTVIMQGRVHYYEGYPMSDVVMPTRLMGMLGAKTLLVTNACGGANPDFEVGDLMVIRDHITSFVPSPLVGPNIGELGVRFPDMSQVYDRSLGDLVYKIGTKKGYSMREGVYCQFTGPQYETPTEVKMAAILGADAVGMSTAVEALAARHMGLKVCGISLITNMAAGLSKNLLSEQEVIEVGENASRYFIDLVMEFVNLYKNSL
ncbi:MAG: purine-nucleoside phosphorylase [Tissierellia bacterium]|nr:purine-nucleoside phosphorylase [Tissierellia bacterium]